MHLFLLVAALGLRVAPAIQDVKDPEDVLDTLMGDLQKAINDAPKDTDKRGKLTTVAKSSFDKEISSALPKNPKPAWDYLVKLCERLAMADKKFSGDALKNERTIWVNGCKSALTQQIKGCKESALADADFPTTEKCFSDLFDQVGKVKGKFVNENTADLRTTAYTGAKDIFNYLLAKARTPEREAKTVYADQLVRIDKSYPTTSDRDKKWNTEPSALLKTSAKAAFDKATSGK